MKDLLGKQQGEPRGQSSPRLRRAAVEACKERYPVGPCGHCEKTGFYSSQDGELMDCTAGMRHDLTGFKQDPCHSDCPVEKAGDDRWPTVITCVRKEGNFTSKSERGGPLEDLWGWPWASSTLPIF